MSRLIRDVELEKDFIQAVLGLGEESPGRLNAELAQIAITKESFTEKWFWEIYCAARDTARNGTRVDCPTVSACVGPEGRGAVIAVWPEIPSYSSIRALGQRLNDYRGRRAAASIGGRIIRAAESPEGELGQELVRAAASLNSAFSSDGSGVEDGREILLKFYEELERAQGLGASQVIPTGIHPMDSVIGGIPRKFITIIGAYPGCFKSGIMATVAANVAASGRRVGFFSLEDNPTWVAKRYVSRATGIPVQDLTRRALRRHELEAVGNTQETVLKIVDNISFDGRSGLTGHDVAASARYMVSQKNVELVIIDHVGEMRAATTRRDRYDLEVGENVRAIRDVAKDTGCAILMAAHLRRKENSEEDIHRIPKMTDFSDSSSIEKMARLCIGLWQPPDDPDDVALKVLKANEAGCRGMTFNIRKDAKSAMVLNS